jgi:hypothetical protein
MSHTPAQRLRMAIENLTIAARRECIEPEGPLGIWVESQQTAFRAMADLAEHQEKLVRDVAVEMKALAEGELAKLRVMLEMTRIALASARGAVKDLETEKVRVVSEMVQIVAPEVVKGIKDAVVIRQVRYNQGVQWRRAAYVGGTILMLVVGGYSWRTAQDWQDTTIAPLTRMALQHCQDTSKWIDDKGRRLCVITDFQASSAPYLVANKPPPPAPPPPPPPSQSSGWAFPGAPPTGPVQFK